MNRFMQDIRFALRQLQTDGELAVRNLRGICAATRGGWAIWVDQSRGGSPNARAWHTNGVGSVLMVVGVSIGWVLTLALKKLLAAVVVIRVAPGVTLLAGLTATLIAVGLLASLAPARKAATVDPMQALRAE
jgi:hypothetical protein